MPPLSPSCWSELAGQVLEGLRDPVAVLGQHGEILWANRRWKAFARKAFGAGDRDHQLPQLCERMAAGGVAGMSKLAEGIRQVVAGRLQSLEHPLILPGEGGTSTHVVQVTPLDAADPGRAFVRIDEAGHGGAAEARLAEGERQRRSLEQQLVYARDRAEHASHAKSAFLASMSHEMRTPLNAILGFAQLLEIEPEADRAENIREILRAGRHLQELLDDVLDLSRIEEGRVELQMEAVRAQVLISECLALAESEAAAARVVLLPPDCGGNDPWIRADRRRLRQVLINLISNAIKYNRPGGRVEVRCDLRQADRVAICVVDTGMGIPEARHNELFTPFNRLGREGSGIEGTGLGLVISRHLVELMGGEIDVDTVPGGGSTFRVTLSGTRPPETEPAIATRVEKVPAAAGDRCHTVLYVEDNPANLRLVEQILGRRSDIRFLGLPHPRGCRELALRESPDLIMLDINLPETDGFELLELMRREPALQRTPFVAVSANAMPPDVSRGLEAGFSRYLTKPLDMHLLIDTVEELLSDRDER
ncbi:hypothetical protein B1C78_09085 [Thioalkalivibrio denitrificans]|uniref:histidine kinase n=1 Tax=Thioalkalivibrio denitrificans TaxID=108003 RepID=A0A1V3NGJ8_9GAMM|nr:ATP-binding protein [Thioalkalivibrio denitrificans]OOG24229.1 hypothetical protein B1C78_09085 [Thioalkalivibrio denitrificans]